MAACYRSPMSNGLSSPGDVIDFNCKSTGVASAWYISNYPPTQQVTPASLLSLSIDPSQLLISDNTRRREDSSVTARSKPGCGLPRLSGRHAVFGSRGAKAEMLFLLRRPTGGYRQSHHTSHSCSHEHTLTSCRQHTHTHTHTHTHINMPTHAF